MKKHTAAFIALVDDARARIAETTVADVKRRLDAGENLTLVDVREDNEWQAGHLPHAQHIGRGVIERDIEGKIPDRTAEVILYCGGGFRSALAADNLQRMGYTNVLSMDGGFRQWRDAGFPIEGETPPKDDGTT
jgi:rhodanese-related sulfurtransferase